jgi:hypothetical protein
VVKPPARAPVSALVALGRLEVKKGRGPD